MDKKKKALPAALPPLAKKKKPMQPEEITREFVDGMLDAMRKDDYMFSGGGTPKKKQLVAADKFTPPAAKKKPAPEIIPVAEVEPPAPAHALLSPSYSKTWLSCAAALAAGLDEPNTSGAAAIEGTLCHQVLENVINRLIDPQCKLDVKLPAWAQIMKPGEDNSRTTKQPGSGRYQGQAAVDYIGVAPLTSHPNMTFTADQAELITPFIDYIRGLMDAGYTVFPEMRVDLSQVLNSANTFGTADLIAFKGDHLIVGDLKMGRHPVSPGTLRELNPQMGLYGAGVLHKYRAKQPAFSNVTLLIAQPRAGGLKFLEDISVTTLNDFAREARKRAASALECVARGRKNLRAEDFNPTPGGCQWCRFRDKCSAKLKVVTGQEAKGTEISDDELFAAWQKIPLLESQIASTQSEVLKRLLQGKKVGDLKVVTGSPGPRKWADDKKAEAYLLGKLYAQAYDKKLISPTTAAKLLKDDATLDSLITRAEGKPSVTTGDDKRKSYDPVSNDDLND